ncbi:hypothetical protein TCSYLVIO_003474 [Trypanosoma cruzi]|nr:hypothetical protein TCSYLVIO_003474 [Trypanosoma cruzi]
MKVPRFPVYIDQFYSEDNPDAVYLLSHFHTDHMKGLSHSWCAGLIICEAVTRALLIQKYGGCMEKCSVSLPLFQRTPFLRMVTTISSKVAPDSVEEREVVLDTVKDNGSDENCGSNFGEDEMVMLYLLPAFHIPGSVMFFLETPFGNVLYTGDFKYDEYARRRLDPFFADHAVDHVYVDDTWLHLGIPELSPSVRGNEGTRVLSKMLSETELEEAIEAVGRRMDWRVREFSLEKNSTDPPCGPYVVRVYLHNQFGKEHIVQRLATRLGVPVVVDDSRYERIRLLASFNETTAEVHEKFCLVADRFVTYANCKSFPRIEVVSSLKEIAPEELRAAAERSGGTPHYGIVMSGWALLRRRGDGDDEALVWEIPTTLHSTPQQIIDFIALLRPMSVTPLHYKPCRGAMVLQRLGPFLRRPYVNQFLSVADSLKDESGEWRRCIQPSGSNKQEVVVYPPKRSGFCIGPSFNSELSPHPHNAFTPGVEREGRKRPREAFSSSIQTVRHDDSFCSATPSLTQLAEFFDL